ncbi:PAS domain-containing protein [Methylobacterium oxalidis]|uniref:Blue-light-activated histidine kinase n=1 Tax=Methylobacterium oxalidis TaxID=944322 RepID=A0A512JC35_9HYPH|nr:PAS domain-containing protein [Methylobacterium oxalidis]GEP07489.1 hypothetical protein MOX02_55270 [Methylobacterium oxalidis]GJE35447.1 Blue-light-activated histidine kinase 1 [Methylobacterium oxalidis]GLS66054.1 hypothetical protein GCM10007888_44360 [Methylobacterium oxalidis]
MISPTADMLQSDAPAPAASERQSGLFRSVLDGIGEAVIITGPELERPGPVIEYVNPAFTRMTGYTAAEAVGQTPRILQGPLTDRAVLGHLRADLETREAFQGTAINYRKDGSTFTMHWHITPLRNEAGNLTHWVALQREIQPSDPIGDQPMERVARVREIMNQAVAGLAHTIGAPADLSQLMDQLAQTSRELQRQVRTTLGLVRSIARRTAETHEAAAEYAAHLDSRIDALQRLKSASLQSPPTGIDLEWLVADELQAFEMEMPDRVRISGPPINLLPQAAEMLGLAIHELTTNALKFGALSERGGSVSVRWRLRFSERVPCLVFRWAEREVSEAISPPSHTGFGLKLLEQILPADLAARSQVRFVPSGVLCRIDLPMSAQVMSR